jgi:ATP-binding cassette subfamily F protein 3
MVAAIRNILGGFLFSGDDVYKRVRVLSGGERTRLAVARMLLRPSNTLLLDEPTNHLDLDSKEVLLDALMAYGGTLIFVSHDRYFVERLATRIIEVGQGTALVYPGTYSEFLWHKDHPQGQEGREGRDRQEARSGQVGRGAQERPGAQVGRTGSRHVTLGKRAQDAGAHRGPQSAAKPQADTPSREERKRTDAEARRRQRADEARRSEIDRLEARIAETEQSIRDIEETMATPGFYGDRAAAQPVIDRHQALMWEVGDLMHRWEELQNAARLEPATDHVHQNRY